MVCPTAASATTTVAGAAGIDEKKRLSRWGGQALAGLNAVIYQASDRICDSHRPPRMA